VAKQAAEAGDDGTKGLPVSGVSRTHEMQVWFLVEHLVDTPPGACPVASHLALAKRGVQGAWHGQLNPFRYPQKIERCKVAPGSARMRLVEGQ
jgi:hypothetical protein